jgi:pyruvate/2-oxoglutarate dehydrogenase complex dihydrolipoamide dehydrogenase (E3) component
VNSEELLRTPTVPEKLMIVGAGYIGCEFASIYRTLGCAVTIIEQKDRILPGWEPEAGERVAQALLNQKVALLLNQHFTLDQIERNADAVRFRQPGGEAVEQTWFSWQPAEEQFPEGWDSEPSELMTALISR